MMNKVGLIGRLTKDPEIRYTQGQDAQCVARYTLAVDRRYKKEGQPDADFIRCVAFGKNGEFAEKYLAKGMKIGVCGHIQTGSYQDTDGKTVYTTDIVVEEHDFCESKGNNQAAENSGVNADANGFVNVPDTITEELPFN